MDTTKTNRTVHSDERSKASSEVTGSFESSLKQLEGQLDWMLPATGDIADELFAFLFMAQDERGDVVFAKLKNHFRERAKMIGRTAEFDELLKAHRKLYLENKRLENEANKALLEKNKGDTHTTQFGEDAPIVLPISADYTTDLVSGVLYGDAVVCPHPVLILNRFENIDDSNRSRIEVGYRSRMDEGWKSCIVSQSTIANKSQIVNLADYSIRVTSHNAGELVAYFGMLLDEANKLGELKTKRSLSRFGWYDDFKHFLPFSGDAVFDAGDEFRPLFDAISVKGDFETWKACITEQRKEIVTRIVLDVALAAPLIELVGGQCFFVHVWGTTAFGKTLALHMAASIWGSPKNGGFVSSLNSTENYMLRKSGLLHNLPFFGDELQTVKNGYFSGHRGNSYGGAYDHFVMSLSEGTDRGKAKAKGGVENLKNWFCPFITTGEEPLVSDHSGGGVKSRVLQIECENKIFSGRGSEVEKVVSRNYGHAGKQFVEWLLSEKGYSVEEVRDQYDTFADKLRGLGVSEKQAAIGALILLGDQFGVESGVFGDARGWAVSDDPNQMPFFPFLLTDSDVRTEQRAYDLLMDVIGTNESKFSNEFSTERWGKFVGRGGTNADTVHYQEVFIIKKVLDDVLRDNGFEFDAVKKKWASDGLLITDESGKFTKVQRLCGACVRCVHLKMKDYAIVTPVTPKQENVTPKV